MALKLPKKAKIPDLFPHSSEAEKGLNVQGSGIGTFKVVVAKDGSGDTDDIQEGINMLGTGGTMLIREGTWLISSPILIKSDGTSIMGCGKDTILQATAALAANGIMDGNSKNNFTIQGVSFVGGAASDFCLKISGARAHVSNCFFNVGADGIEVVSTPGVRIIGNVISDATTGIKLTGADYTIISSNYIYNNATGISIDANTDHAVIMANLFRDSGVGGDVSDAGANTHPNGVVGDNALSINDLNGVA